MSHTVCSCGEILANKQLEYETRMKKICNDLGLDFDTVSQGFIDQNEEYKKKRSSVINDLCRRWCCKQQLATSVDIVQLIKG